MQSCCDIAIKELITILLLLFFNNHFERLKKTHSFLLKIFLLFITSFCIFTRVLQYACAMRMSNVIQEREKELVIFCFLVKLLMDLI